MNIDKTKIVRLLVARKLALNYDYCPEWSEIKKEPFEYISKDMATKKEVQEACNEFQGSRHDEIEGMLANYLEDAVFARKEPVS